MLVAINPEDLFIETKITIWPLNNHDGDPPGFHQILSAPCKFMRHILAHFGKIPPDLSKKIKNMIASQSYCLLFYNVNDVEELLCNDSIQLYLRRSLNSMEPPMIYIFLKFTHSFCNDNKMIKSNYLEENLFGRQLIFN